MAHPSLTAAFLAISLLGAEAPVQLNATAAASIKLLPSGGIAVVTPLTLPSVQLSPGSNNVMFSSSTPSAGTGGGSISGNAKLTVLRDSSEAVSVDVPASFSVVQAGGGGSLTVNTTNKSDLSIAGEGVLLGGTMMGGSATSVDIGGSLSLASEDHLVPGPYDGLFVVVVQYN